MANTHIYVHDDLLSAARKAGTNVSKAAQEGIRQATLGNVLEQARRAQPRILAFTPDHSGIHVLTYDAADERSQHPTRYPAVGWLLIEDEGGNSESAGLGGVRVDLAVLDGDNAIPVYFLRSEGYPNDGSTIVVHTPGECECAMYFPKTDD